MVDATTVLYFNRNSLLAYCNYEIDLGLTAALREMSHVQVEQGAEKIPHGALGEMPRNISQVRRVTKALGRQRDHFLKPGGTQGVIAQTDLWSASPPFQSQFQRLDQAN